MDSEILVVIGLLVIGYVLLLLEVFVPGGVLGVVGAGFIAYGCFLAFGLGSHWGVLSIIVSVVVTLAMVRLFFRSRLARRLVLGPEASAGIHAAEDGLDDLLGQVGTTLSALRPAGVAAFGERRIDVVADSEFLGTGVTVRVVEVEGRRVVVEALPSGGG